jgi:SEC-C motif domain protein
MNCPCGSELPYQTCCGLFIEHNQTPSTPEQLMRSRYTAYSLANIDYIARTMKSPAADHFDAVGARKWSESVEWLRLKVIESSTTDKIGYVEFLVYFIDNGQQHVMHELSEFHLEDGNWYYVNGQSPKKAPHRHMPEVKTRRNDTCYCGSGQKYKKCCGMVSS